MCSYAWHVRFARSYTSSPLLIGLLPRHQAAHVDSIMKRPADGLPHPPGLDVKRCPWLKKSLAAPVSNTHTAKHVRLPCWCLLWSVDRDGRQLAQNANMWVLFKIESVQRSSRAGDCSDLESEERAQRSLLLDDAACASKLLSEPMVSWMLSECRRIAGGEGFESAEFCVSHMWIEASRLPADVKTKLGNITFPDLSNCTLGQKIANEPLYCMRSTRKFGQRLFNKLPGVMCTPQSVAVQAGIQPIDKVRQAPPARELDDVDLDFHPPGDGDDYDIDDDRVDSGSVKADSLLFCTCSTSVCLESS